MHPAARRNPEGRKRAGMRVAILAGGFLLSAVVRTAAQEPARTKGAVVEGVVVNALTGEPLRRVEVGLLRSGAPRSGGVLRVTAKPLQGAQERERASASGLSALTGADGRFLFENVADGLYMVQLRRQGMFPWRGRQGLSPSRIEVKEGVPVRGLRYALAPHAVISGKVLDEEGEPVQGAEVMALRRAWFTEPHRWFPENAPARTDDRGEFRLHGLRPGKYVLLVRPPSVAAIPGLPVRTVYASAYYPEPSDLSQAQPMEASAGEEAAGIVIRLRTVPARSISGAVVLPDGSLAVGSSVSAGPVIRNGIPAGEGRSLPGDAPGKFRIDGLAPGRYRVIARMFSRVTPEQPVPAGVLLSAAREVDLTGGDAEGLEIRLAMPVAVRGKVVIEGPGSEAMNAQLKSLRVSIRNPETDLTGPPVTVAPDGAFQVSSFGTGKHVISVAGGALDQLYVAAIQTSSGAGASEGLEVTEGGAEQVTVILRTDGARLTALRAPSGKPEEECTPYFAVLYDPRHRGSREPLLVREADFGLPAVFSPLAPGEYVIGGVCASDVSEAMDEAFVGRLSRQGTRIRLKPGEQASVELKDIPLQEN